jgi:hypothetical protein
MIAAVDAVRARSESSLVRPAAVLGIAIAASFGALRFANESPAERWGEWFGDLAMAAAYAVPSFLALAGLRSRRVLLLAAGLLGVVLSFTAFSGISLVLLIPAASFFIGYGRAPAGADGSAPRRALAVPVTLILGFAAFLVLFAHQDLLCWSDGCTSDTIVVWEGLSSLALTASSVLAGAWLARPAIATTPDGMPT